MKWFTRFYKKATTLQFLINHAYRFPLSKHKNIIRFGGYFEYWKMLISQRKMMSASYGLKPIYSHEKGLTLYFLTGEKYLYQTLFCIKSLTKFSKKRYKFVLIDDGTFNESLTNKIIEILPNSKIVLQAEIEKNLEMSLPETDFPYLRKKRKIYPHIKKLTDVHTISENPFKMVLDSDMLFFDQPKEIEQWLENPSKCLHMVDCIESYGYSRSLMQNLCGHPIPPFINVGAIGLNSEIINWKDVERWAETLEREEGTSYFLEQALTAMIIAKEGRIATDSKMYIVSPDNNQVQKVEGVLHHYVDQSKKYYYLFGWRNI